MREIQGTPYVPGRRAGRVRRGVPAADSILVVAQSELKPFAVRPAGVIVVEAAPFSHPMIGLLGLGIPTVMISASQTVELAEGEAVVLDGASGRILPGAEADTMTDTAPPTPTPGQPVLSRDGVAIELCASVRDVSGARAALANGAAAIGLVRTEFLTPDDARAPDAGFFEQALGALCEAAQPLPVTVRFIDIAADKRPAWLGSLPGVEGPLGLQGARLYDVEPVRAVLQAQIEAIARLLARYPLRLLVPYIVHLEELRRLRSRIEAQLPRPAPFGAMAETPAAALAIADFFEAADFVALGTNDLMQCLFAADRNSPPLRGYLDPYAPVLYRFLRSIAENAGARLARVQVCGVLSQLPGVLPVLLGLGYRAFSVEPVFIPYLAAAVRQTDIAMARSLADAVCAARATQEVRERLRLPDGAPRDL